MCLNGGLGESAQYWMLYQYMVDLLHQLHYATNRNNYDLRKLIWEEMLPLSFSMNKENYTRYGTYYIMQLSNSELTHHGARQEIEEKGVSVCRNSLNIPQSIAGEQTFIKNSKTSGDKFVTLMKTRSSRIC